MPERWRQTLLLQLLRKRQLQLQSQWEQPMQERECAAQTRELMRADWQHPKVAENNTNEMLAKCETLERYHEVMVEQSHSVRRIALQHQHLHTYILSPKH